MQTSEQDQTVPPPATRVGLRPLARLRPRLAFFALLTLVPAALFLVYDAAEIRQRAERQAQDDVLRTARLIARGYEQRLEEVRRLEAAIALFPEVRDGDAAACSDRLAQFAALSSPDFPAFGVADLDGDLFCRSGPLSPTVNIAHRSWFRDAIRTESFAIGEFTVAQLGGLPILGLGYPVLDESGQVRRVVSHGMRLSLLQEQGADLPLPEDAVLTLADHNGTILARLPGGENAMGQPLPEAWFQAYQARGTGVVEVRVVTACQDSRPLC
jgi:hypothetical protein